jgi:antitoxin (DNA-binding transcriptional repressor) of toxin-antitoxin stability system
MHFMSQMMNITDLRYQGGQLIQSTSSDNPTILLKRGKPVLAIIPYDDLSDYERFKKEQEALRRARARTELQDLFNKSREDGLSKNTRDWLKKKNITADPNSWEYAEEVLSKLEE